MYRSSSIQRVESKGRDWRNREGAVKDVLAIVWRLKLYSFCLANMLFKVTELDGVIYRYMANWFIW